MYSARPTLLTDTLAHVKQRGEGTQREGEQFRPDIRPTDNQCSEKFQVLTDMSMSMMYLPSEHEVTNNITFFTVCRSLSTEQVSYVLAASEDFDRCKFYLEILCATFAQCILKTNTNS